MLLAVANAVRSLAVSDSGQFAFNVAIGVVALTIGLVGGLNLGALGVRRASVRSGLRIGGLSFAAVSTVIVALGAVGLLQDDRVEISGWATLVKILFTIPIGTVLVEELAFRGVLDGFLRYLVSKDTTSTLIGAVAFGAWHVLPAWQGGGVEVGSGTTSTVGLTFVATTVFGAVLIILRRRAGSLIAPVLVHLATNSVTFSMAWLTR